MSNSTYEDWLNARDNARKAIQDVETEGMRKAAAERNYYRQKAVAYARLLQEGNATSAGNTVKGDELVSDALYEFRCAEATYKAACQAAQLFTNEESHCYHEHRIVMSGDAER